MSIRGFIESIDSELKELTVVNRTEPAVVREMLEDLFDGQPVTVNEATGEQVDENTVVLSTAPDEQVTASLAELERAILFVNADIYTTGTRPLTEVETPDVLLALSDLRFRAKGYPNTSKQKLLLIELSRYIEARALKSDDGTLRSGFQRLSRLRDERGTERAYRRLAESGVDVWVYGADEAIPSGVEGLNVRWQDCEELARSWFVVFRDPHGEADAAMVCHQVEGNNWEGFWTFDPERVAEIDDYVSTHYD